LKWAKKTALTALSLSCRTVQFESAESEISYWSGDGSFQYTSLLYPLLRRIAVHRHGNCPLGNRIIPIGS